MTTYTEIQRLAELRERYTAAIGTLQATITIMMPRIKGKRELIRVIIELGEIAESAIVLADHVIKSKEKQDG